MINFESLFSITYGLYIVSSGDSNKGNGFISNSVFQVTAEPPKFAACCNKNNFTADFIIKHRVFSVSVLGIDTPSEVFATFGYKSGRDTDKFAGMNVKYGDSGVPVVLNSCIAFMEFKVTEIMDVGTHLMFIGELLNAETLDETQDPITYAYYRKVRKASAPKNAPTYIDRSKLMQKAKARGSKKFRCPVCGYVYDDDTEKIRFGDLSADWACPTCGTLKEDFIEITNN
jgi:flavin reductase (DIM6/NTAB) family NADH-FMN oxidoreductase RutF/rubredoxin